MNFLERSKTAPHCKGSRAPSRGGCCGIEREAIALIGGGLLKLRLYLELTSSKKLAAEVLTVTFFRLLLHLFPTITADWVYFDQQYLDCLSH